MSKPLATEKQKTALHNMFSALEWPEDKIDDMDIEEASIEISKTKEHIDTYGFPSDDKGSDGFGNSTGW